jgi:hypothetical protein
MKGKPTAACPSSITGGIKMIEIQGAYNTALCDTGDLEKSAAGQIKAVCDQEFFAASKIRIMPDVHAGIQHIII